MSDTPETDAFFFRLDIDWDMEVEFARRLERERDEAVRLIRDLLAILHSDGGHHTADVGLAVSTLDASKKFECLINKREDMMAERDEWRKCAEKLAAIIGPPNKETWATDDELNEAWSTFEKLKEEAK